MFAGLLRLGLFATGAFIALGLLNFMHPALDAMAQFRLHALAGLTVLILIAIFAKIWASTLIAILLGATAFALTAPSLFVHDVKDASTLRVLQFNLWYRNDDRLGALGVLRDADADVLILQELVGTTDPLIAGLRKDYPHGVICRARQRPGNVAVLSRLPLVSGTEPFCHGRKAYARVQLNWQDKAISVSSLHLSWPWPFRQHRQITELEQEFDAIPEGPLIVAGDFNAAPWSHTLRRVAQQVNGTVAPNRYFTWGPNRLRPLGRLGQIISLDQAVLRGLRLKKRAILSEAGSDHRPLLLELVATEN